MVNKSKPLRIIMLLVCVVVFGLAMGTMIVAADTKTCPSGLHECPRPKDGAKYKDIWWAAGPPSSPTGDYNYTKLAGMFNGNRIFL
jgi:hypothetical protein